MRINLIKYASYTPMIKYAAYLLQRRYMYKYAAFIRPRVPTNAVARISNRLNLPGSLRGGTAFTPEQLQQWGLTPQSILPKPGVNGAEHVQNIFNRIKGFLPGNSLVNKRNLVETMRRQAQVSTGAIPNNLSFIGGV